MLPQEPAHHRRYRFAWLSYADPDTPSDLLPEIGKEMDLAQNAFGWDEFQTFKETLPGFMEFWRNWSMEDKVTWLDSWPGLE